MSLKRNLLSNYVGQAYAALVGVVMLPVYVRYLGTEAYGLVGFATVLQGWLQILDLGVTPTVARELSRSRAGVVASVVVAQTVRGAERLFCLVGVLVTAALIVAADVIAVEWLQVRELSATEVRGCIWCIAGMVGVRYLTNLYRGALGGLERMPLLNAAAVAFATVRAVLVVAIFMWSTRPLVFFAYQLAISIVEVAVFRRLFYGRFFPIDHFAASASRTWRQLMPTASSMAFLTGVWIAISQADRLVLSWSIDLEQYGYYVVAVTLAGGITLLATPLMQALQPRFTVLAAQSDREGLVRLYRLSTQLTAAVVFAVAGMLVCFAPQILRTWTGDVAMATAAARFVPLFAAGNAVATLLALAFALQFAFGQLRWHVIGNIAFCALWFPGVFWIANHVGAIGMGWLWLGGNVAYLLLWLPFVYARVMPGLWWPWILADVGLVVGAQAGVLWLLRGLSLESAGRLVAAALIVVLTLVVAGIGVLAGSVSRPAGLRAIRSLLAAGRV